MKTKRMSYQGFVAKSLKNGPHMLLERLIGEEAESLELHGPGSDDSVVLLSPRAAAAGVLVSDRDVDGANTHVFDVIGTGLGPFSVPKGELQAEMNSSLRKMLIAHAPRIAEVAEVKIADHLEAQDGKIEDTWRFCVNTALDIMLKSLYNVDGCEQDIDELRIALNRRSLLAGAVGSVSARSVHPFVFGAVRKLEQRRGSFDALNGMLDIPPEMQIEGLDDRQVIAQLTTGMIAFGPVYFWALYHRDVGKSSDHIVEGLADGMPLVSPPRYIPDRRLNVIVSPYAVAHQLPKEQIKKAFGFGAHHCPVSNVGAFIARSLVDATPALKFDEFDEKRGAVAVSRRPRQAVKSHVCRST